MTRNKIKGKFKKDNQKSKENKILAVESWLNTLFLKAVKNLHTFLLSLSCQEPQVEKLVNLDCDSFEKGGGRGANSAKFNTGFQPA
jgi:hypothetical protein